MTGGGQTGGGGGGGKASGPGQTTPAKAAKTSAAIQAAMAVPRGVTTREYLKMDWRYPVYRPQAEVRSDATTQTAPRAALSREEALRAIAGDDPRPLLVLRECPVCNKTDDALLKGGSDNDRTLVMARWFRCVKLPVDVVEPDHPFNALFPTNDAEHLFLALPDGSSKIPLESEGSRTELWTSMSKVLAAAYETDPSKAHGELLQRFDRIDLLDAQILEIEGKISAETESQRPDKKKVEELDRKIGEIRSQIAKERAGIEQQFQRLPKPKQAPAAAPVPAGK